MPAADAVRAAAPAVPEGTGPAATAATVNPRRARLIDALLTVTLTGYGIAAGLHDAGAASEYPHPGPLTAALVGVAGVALWWRRTRPLPAYLTSIAALTLLVAVGGAYQAGSSLLIAIAATYSAVAYGVAPWTVAAGVLLLATAQGLGGGSLGGPGAAAFVLVALGLAAGAGWLAHRLRRLSAANQALRELLERETQARTEAAVEEERARVARELHDILSHSLAVVALQTAAADHAWDSDAVRARESLRAARDTSLEAVDQLKALLAVTRDDPAGRESIPTVADLQLLVDRSTAAGFPVSLEVTGVPRELTAQIQASLYRIAQEGIANAMKHSGSPGCRIALAYEADRVLLRVDDDGRAGSAGDGARLGLTGIRERARLFGGAVSAGPRDGGGWQLQVTFPL